MTGCRDHSMAGELCSHSGICGTAPISAAVITADTPPIATASFVSIARMPPCAIGELETMGRRRGQSAAVAFDGTFRSGPASFSVPL